MKKVIKKTAKKVLKKKTSLQKFQAKVRKSKPKKKLTLNDFEVTTYVTWAELERVLGKRKYKEFSKWMYGQTCVEHGVYPWDLERFLEKRPVVD